jgi:hypothetical protein
MERTLESVLRDIKEHPENHRHDFAGLQNCCIINGALNALLVEAHEGITGRSRRCDVNKGPCACGAWHF